MNRSMTFSLSQFVVAAGLAIVCLAALPAKAQYFEDADPFGPPSAAPASSGSRSLPLVPAHFNQRSDAQGFQWYISHQGSMHQGTNGCFGNTFLLMANNSHFQPQGQAMMTADGNSYVLQGFLAGRSLEVTRYIKFDMAASMVRYVDSIRNSTAALIKQQVMITLSMNNSYHAIVSDVGVKGDGPLDKKETGIVFVAPQGSSEVSVVVYLAARNSRVRPTLLNSQRGSNQAVCMYDLALPAGRSVAIAYGVSQTRSATLDPKQAAVLLKPFASKRWLRDLPSDLRRQIVNAGSGMLGEEGWDEESQPGLETLGITPGSTDVLAVGPQTRLRGTARFPGVTLETRYGPLQASSDQVAALTGLRGSARQSWVFLRDGQALAGRLQIPSLRFITHSGLEMGLSPETLDRLVLRAHDNQTTDEDKKESRNGSTAAADKAGFAVLQTLDGELVTLAPGGKGRLSINTPWGRLQFGLDEVVRLSWIGEPLGHRVLLRDGTRLFGFLDPANLRLETARFGPQSFSPYSVRAIRMLEQKPSADGRDAPTAPYLVLSGENLLVGQIDLPLLQVATGGQKLRIPPGQIRRLKAAATQDDEMPGFEMELWDGGTINGSLGDLMVPVRRGEATWRVPVRNLVEAHVPTPSVPESTRSRIGQLIRDLGHPEYQKRKAAAAALAELGSLARTQLAEAARQTSDAEIRRSVETLLDAIKE